MNTDSLHDNYSKNFSCQQCGACCTHAPQILFSELKDQSKFFLLQTTHKAVISSSKNPLQKKIIEHYKTIAHTVMIPELETVMFIVSGFSALDITSESRCPQLQKNGLCGIYNNRPSYCVSAPLSLDKPESLQYQSIEFYQNRSKYGWRCDFSENSPLILENGRYSSPLTQKMMNTQLREIRFFTDQWMGFIEQYDNKNFQPHLKLLHQAAISGQKVITDLIVSLQLAVSGEALTEDEAHQIMREQLQHAINLESEATKLKNKINQPVIELAQRLQKDYKKALTQNIFAMEII